jgi:apolipoprotein N-acyltransferase
MPAEDAPLSAPERSGDNVPVSVEAGKRTRTLSPALRYVAGAGAGALLALAFPPVDALAGWLAVPAFAWLVALERGSSARRGATVGLVAGLAFFLVLLSWLRVLGWDAWIALSLICALFWAGAGAVLPVLLRRRWWVLTVPLLWVCMEAVRARIPWGGFPWGRLAFSQADTPFAGWAALAGPALVSFSVALAATALLAAMDALRSRRPGAAAASVAVIVGVAVGAFAVHGADWGGPDGETQPVAIVQGNVPRAGLDFNAQRRAVLDNHVAATEQLAAEVAAGGQPQPAAVIWPENSSDIDPFENADAAAAIDKAADAIGAPILIGAVMVNPDDRPAPGHRGTVLNVGVVWDPVTGPGDRYVKRHPVPFGEYLPLRSLLTKFISRFDRIPRDFARGTEPGFLTVGPVPAGVVICFEVAYDQLVVDAVTAGGQVLVVQTNNATYAHTGQPEQQLAITRVQAVASGRSTVVAATSGISAVIDASGRIQWSAPELVRASDVTLMPLRTGLTPAMRLGGLPELAMALALVGLVIAGRRQPRSIVRAEPSASAPPALRE